MSPEAREGDDLAHVVHGVRPRVLGAQEEAVFIANRRLKALKISGTFKRL